MEKSQNLHAVFLLQFKIFLPQGVDTVNHGLNKLNFRVSKTMLFGSGGSRGGLEPPLPPLFPSVIEKRNRNRHTFVIYFERFERFKNIKNKSLQSCLSIVDFIDRIMSSGTEGSRGAHYPPHPLNLGSYRKEEQKQK